MEIFSPIPRILFDGAADAYRFMTLLHNETTDYVEISRRLNDGRSIDDIFARAKKQWEG